MSTTLKPESGNAAEANQPQSVLNSRAEMDFVNKFAEKLEKGETPKDRGREKQERIRDAMTASDDNEEAGESTEPTKKDKSKTDNSKSGGTQTEPEDDPEDADEDAESDDKPEGPDADDEEEPGSEKDDEEDEDEGEEDDEALDDDEDPTEDDLAKEAQASLEKHGLKVRLKDLPAEARPLVQKELESMKGALTRAMQEAREYRKEEPKLKGELAFIKAHPAHFMAEILEGEKGPEVEKLLNELLAGANTDLTKEALQIKTQKLREGVLAGISAEAQKTEKQLQRADTINNYVLSACRNLKLDYDLVVESVVNKLSEKREGGQTADLSQQEVDAIIGRHQRSRAKLLGEKKAKDRKDEIRGRNRDRKETSPASKGGSSGGVPLPAGKKPPTNDAEFAEHMAGKLASSRKTRR